MYKVNETVVYGTQGICTIKEISEQNLFGRRAEYYVLHPVYDKKSTIFVPVENEELTAKMRKLLSQGEIYDLIKSIPEESALWIENEPERRVQYTEVLARGDRTEMLRLIKALFWHQQAQRDKGKRLHVSDERFMKEAERILYDEFAHVLQIDRDQVLPMIFDMFHEAGEEREEEKM